MVRLQADVAEREKAWIDPRLPPPPPNTSSAAAPRRPVSSASSSAASSISEAREMFTSMPSGPSASITAGPTMWRVAAVAARVTNRTSERSASATGSGTNSRSSAHAFAAISEQATCTSNPRRRRATLAPIRPSPRIPARQPWPRRCSGQRPSSAQAPLRTHALSPAMPRAIESITATPGSATSPVRTSGVPVTRTPRARQASSSTASNPTAWRDIRPGSGQASIIARSAPRSPRVAMALAEAPTSAGMLTLSGASKQRCTVKVCSGGP